VSGNGSFSHTFSSGILDASKWLASDEPAPGRISGINQGSFIPSNVDLSKGLLCLKLQQQQGSSGVISIGGQIQSLETFGYGTYEWTMRASSTSATPNGSGLVVSGQISSGFIFVNNSQTEIDFEIEGQTPRHLMDDELAYYQPEAVQQCFCRSSRSDFSPLSFCVGTGKNRLLHR
jgi:endo-1,3-1,4-beta-glycanase ExoK